MSRLSIFEVVLGVLTITLFLRIAMGRVLHYRIYTNSKKEHRCGNSATSFARIVSQRRDKDASIFVLPSECH